MNGNWIYQTTTTTGAGNLTLAAVAGYPQIGSQFAVGEILKYQIIDDTTGAPIEQGLGTLNGSSELVRSKVQATFNAGTYDGTAPAAVSLPAGTKRVIVSLGAQSTVTAWPAIHGAVRGYGDIGSYGSATTISPTAGLSYAMPFAAAVDADVDAIVFRVTNLNSQAAGGTVKCSIWSVGLDGLPSIKIAEATATVSATGVIPAVFASPVRPPSRFFVVFTSDTNYTFQGFNGANGLSMMGTDSLLVPIGAISKTGSGANHPADWSSPTNILSSSSRPQLVCRCV